MSWHEYAGAQTPRQLEYGTQYTQLLPVQTYVKIPSASLTIWLCNGVSQFTLIVSTDPRHEFRRGEHASGFHHGPFPMDPFGFNGIEPGTLAR